MLCFYKVLLKKYSEGKFQIAAINCNQVIMIPDVQITASVALW